MRILIAPDKFKGSLDAFQVCDAVSSGLTASGLACVVECIPLADGGEGTCRILTAHNGGSFVVCPTVNPLGRQITTEYGISPDGQTAYIEMAAASGLHLLGHQERNPLQTSTFGTGLMVRNAIAQGARRIVLGIGGSATNDAGTGMAAAMGYEFYDQHGGVVNPNGRTLSTIFSIKRPVPIPWKGVSFVVLYDVSTPLFGPDGAAFVFSPQKGADNRMAQELDDGLRHFASVVKEELSCEMTFPGGGAGGGAAAGVRVFFDGELVPGVEFVSRFVALPEMVRRADVVVTGEGKVDRQTLSGKVVKGVSLLCQEHGKPLVVVCGRNELDDDGRQQLGAAAIVSLSDSFESTEQAMRDAYRLIRTKIAELFSGGSFQ